MNPTIVLIHGAFAESASWNGVISRLQAAGHRAVAPGNPLRSLSSDAESVSDLLATIDGPVVLVGHSYGGAVISNVTVTENVKALVYVAALAPDKGETTPDLLGKFAGATLGEHLYEVPRSDGTADVYVLRESYHEQFCADVPAEQAALDAAAQRPFNTSALNAASAEPAWKTIPSWFISPMRDLAIPLETFRFMADRANAQETVEIAGASHALPVSQPQAVADFILRVAAAV
ncbi:alpha/beta hydrolase [Actinoplanes bogorensis]|uniref:Alpha/beta hydrolase n=1 Tax=Paractinoplanes bogorensis TaxID=1610840 RepID=A0ABS5YRL3_9ACTN|nr:alpha/beta hydrolase [Actinoplanes bogorensis]MBU2666069.1 alpha/beta hydrolase [Actinoplanes bogorensis]